MLAGNAVVWLRANKKNLVIVETGMSSQTYAGSIRGSVALFGKHPVQPLWRASQEEYQCLQDTARAGAGDEHSQGAVCAKLTEQLLQKFWKRALNFQESSCYLQVGGAAEIFPYDHPSTSTVSPEGCMDSTASGPEATWGCRIAPVIWPGWGVSPQPRPI